MYRDFSEKSKQQLLQLVAQVENEKISDFTDWIGDRWLDFEAWIGKLNIQNYINDINKYHKKVIDRNNTTATEIERIFYRVDYVDQQYKNYLTSVESAMKTIVQFVNRLSDTVSPGHGRYSKTFNGYIPSRQPAIKSSVVLPRKYLLVLGGKDVKTKKIIKLLKTIRINQPALYFRFVLHALLRFYYTQNLINGDISYFDIEHVMQNLEPIMPLIEPIQIEDTLETDYSIIYTIPIYEYVEPLKPHGKADDLNLSDKSEERKKEEEKKFRIDKFLEGITKWFSQNEENKNSKNKDAHSNKPAWDLAGSVISYVTGLFTVITGEYHDIGDVTCGFLDLTKDSGSLWSGLYKFYDAKLSPLQASRLSKRFGTINSFVMVGASLCGLGSDTIDLFRTFIDKNATNFEKTDAVLNEVSSGFNVTKAGITVKLGKKSLRRPGNGKYVWSASEAKKTALKKANTIVSLADVGVDTIRGAASRYYEVTADGNFDAGDMGEVGIYGPIRGIASIISKGTFGISDALGLSEHADDISGEIVNFANTKGVDYVNSHAFSSAYVRGAKNLGMYDYMNDDSKNIVGRVAVSAVAGAGMVTAVAIDGVGDVCSAIGNAVSKGWKKIFG